MITAISNVNLKPSLGTSLEVSDGFLQAISADAYTRVEGTMPNFWSKQVLTSFQIAAWSQVGVLVRLYLDLFFTNGCNGAWGVCLLSQGRRMAWHSPSMLT